jgi:putative ABC transport system permease protein
MINKLVVENLKHRPVRTLLSMLAIGIEVTMVLTLVGLSYGMLEESARRTRGVGADIIVRPPSSSVLSLSGAPMPEGLRKFFETVPGVSQVTGTVVQPIVIPESITGLNLDEFNRMSGGVRYIAGGPFRKSDDVLIDEYYSRQRKLKVGDKVNLLNRDWTVCGIVEPGKLSRIFVPLDTLQELTGNRGKLSQIYLKLADAAKVDEVANHLRNGIPELKGYQIYTTEELASLISIDNVPGLKAFISVIVGLAVVIGFLVVFLAMYTAVLERTREIGTLKAIGASPGYVLNVLLRETAVLAIAGSLIGIGLSFVTRWLIETLVPASLQQKVVPEWWPLTTLIAVVGAGLGTLYPAWKAAKQDAIEALAYD